MSNEKLRSLCIKNNWFTCGTNSQYEKLFQLNEENAPAQDLALVIWVCSEGWEWLDIVKALEAEADR